MSENEIDDKVEYLYYCQTGTDLPGVKELIEMAYRAGYQEALDLTNILSPSSHLEVKDFKDDCTYEYMKEIEGDDDDKEKNQESNKGARDML